MKTVSAIMRELKQGEQPKRVVFPLQEKAHIFRRAAKTDRSYAFRSFLWGAINQLHHLPNISIPQLEEFVAWCDKESSVLGQGIVIDQVWGFEKSPLRYIFCQDYVREKGLMTNDGKALAYLCSKVGWNLDECLLPQKKANQPDYTVDYFSCRWEDEGEEYKYLVPLSCILPVRFGATYKKPSGKVVWEVQWYHADKKEYELISDGGVLSYATKEELKKDWVKV